MFVDINLKILNAYEVNKNDRIDPTFDKQFLSDHHRFIFIQQKRVKFFDRFVKYNILYDINSHTTLYIPCAICDGRVVDNYHNSITLDHHILSDDIFDVDFSSHYRYLNHKYDDKQYIVIDRNNHEIEKIGQNMYRNIVVKEAEQKTVEQKQRDKEQQLYKEHYERYLKIRNELSKELNDVLNKYHVEFDYCCGEIDVIFEGETLHDESFLSLFN